MTLILEPTFSQDTLKYVGFWLHFYYTFQFILKTDTVPQNSFFKCF